MTEKEVYETVVVPFFERVRDSEPLEILETVTNQQLVYLIAFFKDSLQEFGIPEWDEEEKA